MTARIWKFELTEWSCAVRIPRDHTVLSVGEQDGRLCLWAAVDPASEVEDCRFETVGTGMDVPDCAAHRGTVQMSNGLVWHVFEVSG